MGNEGRPIRIGDPVAAEPPGVTDLLDPVALEERLKEARARRAAALAGRTPPAPGRPGFAEAAARYVAAPAPVPESVVMRPAELPAPVIDAEAVVAPFARAVRVPVWAIFVTGLVLGAAVVALVARSPAPSVTPVAAVAPEPAASEPPRSEPAVAAVSAADETAPPAASVTPEPLVAAAASPEAPPAGINEPASAAVAPATPAPAKPAAPAAEPAPASRLVTAAPVEPPTSAESEARAEAADASPTPAPDPAADPAAASVETASADADPLPTRVIINYPPSAAAEADSARAALLAAGVANVATVPVRLDISRSNVRYYHDGDGSAAATVAALLASRGEPLLARDFTDYATPAAAGALEVWLAGDSGRGSAPPTRPQRAAGAAAAPAAAPAPATPRPVAGTFVPDPGAPLPAPTVAPSPAGPQDQAEAVARIIVERAYERLTRMMPSR